MMQLSQSEFGAMKLEFLSHVLKKDGAHTVTKNIESSVDLYNKRKSSRDIFRHVWLT